MRTEISQLGEFGLIDRLLKDFAPTNPTTLRGPGDDAAVIDTGGGRLTLLSSDMMLEGVDFDLTYFPLRHLGYKVVTRGVSDILAMNGTPTQLTLSVGVSAKLSVEDLEELYAGVRLACAELGCDLAGGDTTASVNGLALAVSVVGSVARESVVYRGGARENDLVCITRDLGAAYLGLHLLEREKRSLQGVDNPEPQFKGYEYLLERQLRPRARKDVVDALATAGIVPSSMIDLSDGLASDVLQICRASRCGVRLYLDRLPIARESYALAEEMHIDPVVAALNGGDDHELLFTVPLGGQASVAASDTRERAQGTGSQEGVDGLAVQERLTALGLGIEIIGHITPEATGAALTTPDGSDIPLRAQGFRE